MDTLFEKGQRFTSDFIVSEEVYISFQNCSKDMNPLHTDEKFAQERGFKSIVMYGNILNAFLSYFVGECLPLKNVIIHSQDINYKKPVYLNDSLVLEAQVDELFESVNAAIFKYKFINQAKEIIAKGKIQIGILQ